MKVNNCKSIKNDKKFVLAIKFTKNKKCINITYININNMFQMEMATKAANKGMMSRGGVAVMESPIPKGYGL